MECIVCGKNDSFYYKLNGWILCSECANMTVSQLYNECDIPIVELVSEVAAEKLPEIIGYRDALGAKKFHLVQDSFDYEKTLSHLMRGNGTVDFQCMASEIPEGYEDEELIYGGTDSVVVDGEKVQSD